MSETRIKLLIFYIVAVLSAYLLKKVTLRIADKAIKEEELSTGIYRFFPIRGKRAVELAKGYTVGINIYFWFIVMSGPIAFLYLLLFNAI
ncbi:MAG: hypothetical protein ABSA46_16365 [Thermodesulfovibrionales bacterium]|jgi:hypothetical protein